MSGAATLRCPSCGALADPDARSCDYCSAVLALTSCPSCFAAMFVGAKHCSRCGAEATREAAELSPRACPECREPLAVVSVGAVRLDECHGCGGLFLSKAAFERLCSEREQQAVVLKARLASPRSPRMHGVPDRYWPCPDCARLMNRQNFARISGVVLDTCGEHGVWFNHGELTRIVEFVRAGGLSRARDRELQDVKDERGRLKDEQRMAAIRSARLPERHDTGGGDGLDIGSLLGEAADLFDDIFLK